MAYLYMYTDSCLGFCRTVEVTLYGNMFLFFTIFKLLFLTSSMMFLALCMY